MSGVRSIRRPALVVFLVAFGILALVGLDYRDDPFHETPVSDAASYHAMAERIAANGFAEEAAFHQSPLFPVALAAVYVVAGDGSASAALAFQALLLALAVALLVPISRELFRRPEPGVAAAVVALAYAPFAFHALKLLPFAIALATQALALVLLLRVRRDGRIVSGALAGIALGLACLARAEFVLFLPVALAIVWPQRRRRGVLLASLAGLVLTIAPVTLHNRAQGESTLIASAGGENLFIGNQRGGHGGHRPLDPRAGDLPSQRALARKIAEDERGEQLSARQVSAYWRGRALDEIASDPVVWLMLEGRKAWRLFTPGDPTDFGSLPLEREHYVPSLHALPLPTAALWMLAGAGALVLGRRGRSRAWPLLALLGLHALVLMVFFVSTRLRLPLLFWLCPFAGAAVIEGLDRWRRGAKVIPAVGAIVLVLLAWADLRWQRPDEREVVRLAAVLSKQQRLDESLAVLEPYLAREDAGGRLLDQAGWVRSKMGDLAGALEAYHRAIDAGLTTKAEQKTRSRMATVLERMGRVDEAGDQHIRSIELDPLEPGVWFERAGFRMRRGDRSGTIADLREASRLMPEWRAPRDALHDLGAADSLPIARPTAR